MAQRNIHPVPRTSPDLIEIVRKGYPSGRLDQIAQKLSIDRAILLSVLGVSERTMQRKSRAEARLSPVISDRLARVERILHLATEILGTEEKAILWLKRPNRALDSEMPLRLLDTDAGAQHVEQELRQIQHGFVF